jgi:hypothetical protein
MTGGTLGDGNGDGTPDALQTNVTSLPFLQSATAVSNPGTATTVYVSLIADSKGGKTRLDFKITDGGQFDSDGKADSIITDPGAPGIEKDSDHDQFPDALEAANGLTVGIKDNDVFNR